MPKKGTVFSVASKAFDPHLEALFSSSAGPVKAPPSSRYTKRPTTETKTKSKTQDEDGNVDNDEELSEASEELDYDDDEDDDSDETSETSNSPSDDEDEEEKDEKSVEAAAELMDTTEDDTKPRRDRKRKRKDDNEELEGKYFSQLVKEDEKEPEVKRQKPEEETKESEDEDDEDEVPVHESLTSSSKSAEAEKASRTVFLANVSTEAISSKAAKKTLMNHLSSALDTEDYPIQKIESIRFRSVAFSTAAMPKRAAYITKNLMDATTKSTNAYVVFSTDAAARRVCSQLNGTEILGRHIRVDNVAHPSPTDHRRCVFVGNLGFVDDESIVKTNSDGETERKKRNRTPADVEEGLWRTFSKQGKVENVRVVRDAKTRVGKGFAYVQFYDANSVETALLLDGKKFPPMLPRNLRVTRAKDPRKTTQAIERARAKANSSNETNIGGVYNPRKDPNQQAAAGRASKLYGRSGASNSRDGLPNGFKSPSRIIFEGRRASAKDTLPTDLKPRKKGKGKKVKPNNRGARRAAEWKKKKETAE